MWQSLKDLLAKEAVKEAIRFVVPVLIAIAAAAAGSFSLTGLAGVSLWVTIPLFILLSLVLGVAAVSLYRRYISYRPIFPPVRPDFRVRRTGVRYEYHAIDRMTYLRKWTLEARRDGLDRFSDKFSWTGTGSVNLTASREGQRISMHGRQGVWQHYDVHFERTLSKGDQIEVEVRWELEDALETAVDFFSKTIQMPTDELEMVFRAYDGCRIGEVVLEKCRTLEMDDAYWTELRTPDEDRFVRWTIGKPTFGHLYRVSWNDPDRAGPNLA